MKKSFFPMLMIIPLLLQVSGCAFLEYPTASTSPIEIAQQSSEVQNFLAKYPYAKTTIDYFPESEISAVLSQVRRECSNPAISAAELYKVTFTDETTGVKIVAWIDWREKTVACAVK